MRKLFREKFTNPMLGIFGGHLLLLEKSFDYPLFRDVVGSLRGMLGSHPDVEALALRADILPHPPPFKQAPILSRSWSLVMEATIDRPELVTDSLAERSGEASSEGAWYLRRSTQSATVDFSTSDFEFSDVEAALAEELGVSKAIRRMRRVQPAAAGSAEVQAIQPTEEDIKAPMSSTRLRSMVTRFGIPAPQLKGVLGNLELKLNSNPRLPNLKVTYE
jgi:hypothetical protein